MKVMKFLMLNLRVKIIMKVLVSVLPLIVGVLWTSGKLSKKKRLKF